MEVAILQRLQGLNRIVTQEDRRGTVRLRMFRWLAKPPTGSGNSPGVMLGDNHLRHGRQLPLARDKHIFDNSPVPISILGEVFRVCAVYAARKFFKR